LALVFLNQHIKSHHWDDQAMLFKALSLKHLSCFEAADRAVAAAIQLNPKRSRSRLLNSLLFIKRVDIEAAIAEADQAVCLDPKKLDLQIHKAKLLERAKKYGEALAAYKAAAYLDGAAEAGVQQMTDRLMQRQQGRDPEFDPCAITPWARLVAP
jgi:tetratricopeptide (TPR) repeat protein